jgi:ABC-2 type transport system permease protein
MIALVGAELLKARTTRSALGLALGLLAIVVFFGSVHAATLDLSPVDPSATGDNLSSVFFVPVFAIIFGILASAGEYRHGTISQTLLVTPSREKLVGAKVISAAIVGVALWAAAAALALLVCVIWFAARGISFDGGDAASTLLPAAAAAAMWAALGIGLGFILPSQVGAIVTLFAWLFVVESIIEGLLPGVHHFMPGGLLNDLLHGGDEHFSRPVAGLLTLAYVAGFAVVGTALAQRRDVT